MLKEADQEALDLRFIHRPDGDGVALLVARGWDRAARRQDCISAEKMTAAVAGAADMLEICGRQVALRHAESFHSWTDCVHIRSRNRDCVVIHRPYPLRLVLLAHPVVACSS